MPQHPIACFRSNLSSGTIEAESGIIRGVNIMQLGKLATFAGPDGNPRQVKITQAHIDALLSHAGNRAIPIHHTHDWFDAQGKPNADTVEMNARIGALKSFRKSDSGDLIADAYLKEGQTRNDIIWAAEHNPEDTMFSAVFGYRKDDASCMPQNFRAADVVPNGAATTALFKTLNTATLASMDDSTIDIQKLLVALANPEVKTALKAILDSHEDAPAAPAADEVAEMEDAAGVTPSDDEKKDTSPSAMMKRYRKAVLAIAKLAKSKTVISEDETTALLAKAEASFTKKIGSGAIKLNLGVPNETLDGESYITAQLAADCPNRATAIARMSKDKPEVYATFRGQKQTA